MSMSQSQALTEEIFADSDLFRFSPKVNAKLEKLTASFKDL